MSTLAKTRYVDLRVEESIYIFGLADEKRMLYRSRHYLEYLLLVDSMSTRTVEFVPLIFEMETEQPVPQHNGNTTLEATRTKAHKHKVAHVRASVLALNLHA